jgi:hypothetical protein
VKTKIAAFGALLAILSSGVAALAASRAARGSTGQVILCKPFARLAVHRYVIRNDVFRGTSVRRPAHVCIDALTRYPSFTITSSDASSRGQSVAYPSAYWGCVYGQCSAGYQPVQATSVARLALTACYRLPVGGHWNASLDIWFSRRKATGGHPFGAEIMIWFADHGFARRHQVSHARIDGREYQTYEWMTNSGGTVSQRWPLIVFRRVSQIPSGGCAWRVPLGSFFRYAESAGWLSKRDWLESVNAGFELWQGGTGGRLSWLQVWPAGQP